MELTELIMFVNLAYHFIKCDLETVDLLVWSIKSFSIWFITRFSFQAALVSCSLSRRQFVIPVFHIHYSCRSMNYITKAALNRLFLYIRRNTCSMLTYLLWLSLNKERRIAFTSLGWCEVVLKELIEIAFIYKHIELLIPQILFRSSLLFNL